MSSSANKAFFLLMSLFLFLTPSAFSNEGYKLIETRENPVFRETEIYIRVPKETNTRVLKTIGEAVKKEPQTFGKPVTIFVLLPDMTVGEEYWAVSNSGKDLYFNLFKPEDLEAYDNLVASSSNLISGFYKSRTSPNLIHVIDDEGQLKWSVVFKDGATDYYPMRFARRKPRGQKLYIEVPDYYKNGRRPSFIIYKGEHRISFPPYSYNPANEETVERFLAGTPGVGVPPKISLEKNVLDYSRENLTPEELFRRFESLEGDPRATLWIARILYKGRLKIDKDEKAAKELAESVMTEVMKLAEEGDAEAQFLIGSCFYEGLMQTVDIKAAVAWYEKAVTKNHLIAHNNLGAIFINGKVVDFNLTKAREHFKAAASFGSRQGSKNLRKYGDDGRDDTQRLKDLFSEPLIRVIGMELKEAEDYLVKNELMKSPLSVEVGTYRDQKQYLYKPDGIVLNVSPRGRIMNVEGHGEGSRGSTQFKGGVPLGLTWGMSKEEARKKMGYSDSSGYVSKEHPYGMAFRTENVFISLMFSREKGLNLWRVWEVWPMDYSTIIEK